MAKTITLTYEGREYTLEFTRTTIAEMERRGFRATDIEARPMSTLPALFSGAFLAHHRNVKANVIDAIFNKIPNKQDFIFALGEMYNEPLESLTDEPEESEGNATWSQNW